MISDEVCDNDCRFYFILFFWYDASILYTWSSTNQLLCANFIRRHEALTLIKLDLHKVGVWINKLCLKIRYFIDIRFFVLKNRYCSIFFLFDRSFRNKLFFFFFTLVGSSSYICLRHPLWNTLYKNKRKIIRNIICFLWFLIPFFKYFRKK